MTYKIENGYLNDIGGEGNLASALGVGTDVVNGLWKQLKKSPEIYRQLSLEKLALEVAEDYGYLVENIFTDGFQMEVEQLAKRQGISSRLVKPLVLYSEDYLLPRNYTKERQGCWFNSWFSK